MRQQIWAAIRALRARGDMAILLIDKSLREISAVSDRAVILERGRTVWAGAMSDLGADISDRYIGV